MKKTIVIVGLGLIGGSMARALHGFEDYEIVGVDVSQPTLRYALEQGVVDRVEEDAAAALAQGDLVFLCLHPQGILSFLEAHKGHFKPGAMVTDVCGIKGAVLEGAKCLPASVSFVGGMQCDDMVVLLLREVRYEVPVTDLFESVSDVCNIWHDEQFNRIVAEDPLELIPAYPRIPTPHTTFQSVMEVYVEAIAYMQ